jgi:hypothetical protein
MVGAGRALAPFTSGLLMTEAKFLLTSDYAETQAEIWLSQRGEQLLQLPALIPSLVAAPAVRSYLSPPLDPSVLRRYLLSLAVRDMRCGA